MLGKLFKQEWKSVSKSLLLFHIIILVVAILGRILIEAISNVSSGDIILGIFFSVFVIMVVSVMFLTFIFLSIRYYRNIYTVQGYLTNTLPVSPAQIVWSKAFTFFIWIILDCLFIIGALAILFISPETMQLIGEAFAAISKYISVNSMPVTVYLVILVMIISTVASIFQMYFCISIGNLFTNHKVLGSILTYFGTYTVLQIVYTILIVIFAASSTATDTSAEIMFTSASSSINLFLIIFAILNLVLFGIFYVGNHLILTKKLNLE
ncbi:MAG: hypothetical protein ACK5MN_00205 [Lachnospiraceae bacterium]